MNTRQTKEAIAEARLALRRLGRVMHALDEQLRCREVGQIDEALTDQLGPLVAPERLSALLTVLDDATEALDRERQRLHEGSLFGAFNVFGERTDGPLPEGPVATAADLGQLLGALARGLPSLLGLLQMVHDLPEAEQARRLPGASLGLLAADVRQAVDTLLTWRAVLANVRDHGWLEAVRQRLKERLDRMECDAQQDE